MLADYLSVKLTNEALFNFFCIAQTVKFSPYNNNVPIVIFTSLSFLDNNNLLLSYLKLYKGLILKSNIKENIKLYKQNYINISII